MNKTPSDPLEANELYNQLKVLGLDSLADHLKNLQPQQIENLTEQVAKVDWLGYRKQQAFFAKKDQKSPLTLEAFTNYQKAGKMEYAEEGRRRIKKGEAACLIVAGGQGSRLGFDGPKGLFPITPYSKKSLFQFFSEKIAALSHLVGRSLPLAIMTSPHNHEETVSFFQEHNFFGLQPSFVDFFMQEHQLFLDEEGQAFLDRTDHLAEGPNGNGVACMQLVKSGVWDKWQQQGVRLVNFIQIDNPLADPFDAELIGYTAAQDCDVVIKSIKREDPQEKVGVIVLQEEKVSVVEYSEIEEKEQLARDSTGELKHPLANISQFCFNRDFIQRVGEMGYEALPMHCAHKATSYLNESGKVIRAKDPMAWKFETFIFDLLKLSKHTGVLVYPRSACYASVKNAEGPHSPKTVQEALEMREREIWERVKGVPAPDERFELPMEMYYADYTERK